MCLVFHKKGTHTYLIHHVASRALLMINIYFLMQPYIGHILHSEHLICDMYDYWCTERVCSTRVLYSKVFFFKQIGWWIEVDLRNVFHCVITSFICASISPRFLILSPEKNNYISNSDNMSHPSIMPYLLLGVLLYVLVEIGKKAYFCDETWHFHFWL